MRCKWCGKEHRKLSSYIHSDGRKYELCSDCIADAKEGRCRICKRTVDINNTIKGLCSSCMQLEAYRRPKLEESVIQKLEDELNVDVSHGMPITDGMISDWVKNADIGLTPDMLKTDMLARQLWMMTMYKLSGIKDNNVINETKRDIEWILDNELEKVTYVNTRIAVEGTDTFDEMVKGRVTAAKRGKVHFVLIGDSNL